MQTDRVRVLNFVGVFAIGGTERHVVNLARELDSSQFELYLACFEKAGQFLHELESLSIPITEYRISSFFNFQAIRQQFRFASYLRRHKIQVVHTYGFYTTVFAVPAAKLARVPVVVVSIRDVGEQLTARQLMVQRMACRLADSVLVNAEAVRQWLIDNKYRADNIQVIRNGIDSGRFDKPADRSSIREELGLPPHVPLVAMIGRINPLKGVEYFLEAAASVAKSFPDARFLVIGDCVPTEIAYREELKRKAALLGFGKRIVFTGFRLDIANLLSQISISVLPSLSEGLSNVLIESMAAGVPVIATRVGGSPELIENGTSGLLVQPANSAELASAMSLLIQEPEFARRLGEAGKRRIREQFSLRKMVRSTEQYYLEMLERYAQKPRLQATRVAK